MIRRVLRIKLFLAATVESLNLKIESFLVEKNMCVGNYIESKLVKAGPIYQFRLVYAEVINDANEAGKEVKK